jgi:hypothetical protein
MSQITLPENHVFTLKKNSIENYLLVPAAIKRAFPSVSKSVDEIRMFLKERDTTRNKKQVLDDFFKDVGLGKYDHEKASLIASKMKKSEIDHEIVAILNQIVLI